jgi:hypothetical protein
VNRRLVVIGGDAAGMSAASQATAGARGLVDRGELVAALAGYPPDTGVRLAVAPGYPQAATVGVIDCGVFSDISLARIVVQPEEIAEHRLAYLRTALTMPDSMTPGESSSRSCRSPMKGRRSHGPGCAWAAAVRWARDGQATRFAVTQRVAVCCVLVGPSGRGDGR